MNDHFEAIRELNERGASHLITMMDACSKACLERDQARAAARRGLLDFQRELAEWAEATFPSQSTAAKIAHLADEVEELRLAPTDAEEMADCLLLLLNVANRAGVDLLEAARQKLAKNRARKWGAPDSRGVVKHVETA